MPYLVITHQDSLIDRREFDGPLTIGRAQECDLAIRDILLSRKHLCIRPAGDAWEVADLGSKNGTAVNGEPITTRILQDGDSIRAGKSRIVFFAAALSLEDAASIPPVKERPVDPIEALAGTVASYTVPEIDEPFPTDNGAFPSPQPAPKYPASYERAKLHSLLSTIASSSWDSIYAEARQITAPVHAPAATDESPRFGLHRPRSPVDFSLQVCVPIDRAAMKAMQKKRPGRWRQRRLSVVAGMVWTAAIVLGAALWTVSREISIPRQAAADVITPQPSNPLETNASVLFPTPTPTPKATALAPVKAISIDAGTRQRVHDWIATHCDWIERKLKMPASRNSSPAVMEADTK